MTNNKLKFGNGNAKLSKSILTFSLPAGYTCPMAYLCLSKANPDTGKITDGEHTEFRCFSASSENIFPNVRKNRWHNFNLLKGCKTIQQMADLIQSSLDSPVATIRCHVSGDFYTEKYFLAWLNIASNNPNLIIYGYTKMVNFLVKYKNEIPSNFRFTASYGGKLDHLIAEHNLISAKVVYSVKEATDLGLEIDHDDSHSINYAKSYALLLHGIQAKNTPAAKALSTLKKHGLTGYSRKNIDKNRMIHAKVAIKVKQIKSKSVKNPINYLTLAA